LIIPFIMIHWPYFCSCWQVEQMNFLLALSSSLCISEAEDPVGPKEELRSKHWRISCKFWHELFWWTLLLVVMIQTLMPYVPSNLVLEGSEDSE
jgi:hypothetical protein